MKTLLLLLLIATPSLIFSQETIDVGILTDLDTQDERNIYLKNLILEEFQKTIGSSYVIRIQDSNLVSTQFNMAVGNDRYVKLRTDCDLIVLLGGVSMKSALNAGEFIKPTLGLGVFSTQLQEIPITDEFTSGEKNFSYILTSQDIIKELITFKDMANFSNITFLFDQRVENTSIQSQFNEKLKQTESEVGIGIDLRFVDHQDIANSVSQIPDETEAVYIAIPYEFTPTEKSELIRSLNARKIPSFSINHQDVQNGALACITENNGMGEIVRKLSIMADDAIRGDDLSNINVTLNHKEDLYLNMETARKIDFTPSFQILFTANIVGDPVQAASNTYSIQDIVKLAIESNLNIKIAQQDVEISANEIEYAKSQFLPDADIFANGIAIDKNRPNPLIGQAQYSISGTGKIQQLIYSESVRANIQIQKYLLEAQKYVAEQEILTQILNCYSAYFSILRAKTNVQIQMENLEASKTNLEVAKVRANLGSKNKADVYRWESEVASSKQNIVEAQSSLMLAKIQLNTLLNNQLERDYDIRDISLDDELFLLFSKSELAQNLKNPVDLRILTEFLSSESQSYYPTKRQLLANLSATDRQILMFKRQYTTPTLAFSAQLDQNFYRGGLGSTPNPGTEFYNTTWNAGLSISYPLFDGNRRKINLHKAVIQRNQLHDQIDNLDQSLALQVNANTLNMLTSTTDIHFTRISADNAERNFELVQNNYRQGTVSITQLIDAQKAALNAKLAYSISIYNYLVNFLELENSIGNYSMLSTSEEKTAFQQRYMEFISNYKK